MIYFKHRLDHSRIIFINQSIGMRGGILLFKEILKQLYYITLITFLLSNVKESVTMYLN